jgi:type IV secretory pathway VirJ component
MRPRFARALPLAALVLAGASSPAAPAQSTGPANVKVTTSRGAFTMVVYAPSRAPAAAPSGAAAAAGTDPKPVVLLVSGEGGWKSFDILLATDLAAEGYWIGGVDAKAYFSDPQDDRGQLASDMRAFAEALQGAAGRPPGAPLVLVGYSFGADVAPWIAGAAGWGGRVRGQLLIGPDENGSLQYRITEMLGINYKAHSFAVADALRSAAGIPTVFIHGEKDGWSAAPKLFAAASEPRRLFSIPGATHHFGGHEDELRAALRDGMAWIVSAPAPPARPGRPA